MYKYLKIIVLMMFIGLIISPSANAGLMVGNTPSYAAYNAWYYTGTNLSNVVDRNFTTSDTDAKMGCNGGAGCAGIKDGAVVQDFTYPYRIQNITIKFNVTDTQGFTSPLLYASVLNYQTGLWENTYIEQVTIGNGYNGTTFFNGSVIARYVRIYVSYQQSGATGEQSYENFELQVYGDQSYDVLTITSPVNQSVNQSRTQSLKWRTSLNNAPYIVNTSLNANMSSNTTVATVSSYTSYSGSYYYWSTPTLYFPPNTTIYWQPKDIFDNNVTGNFTTVYEPPGILNIQVKDEQTGEQVYSFTTNIYNLNGNSISKSTIFGFTNFTSSEVPSYLYNGVYINKYIIVVVPDSNITSYTEQITTGNTTNTYLVTNGTGYSPRTTFENSPSNLTMYVPSLSEPNIIVLNQFKLNDLSGIYPISNSYITVSYNNTTMFKGYFDASGNANIWLIQGVRYSITVTNDLTGSIYNFGNYVPQYSQVVLIDISTSFSPNFNILNPIIYNVTGNYSGYTLKWSDSGSVMNSINFKVYNSTSIIDTYSSTSSTGSYTKATGYASIFNYTLSILLKDGTYLNSSNNYDFQNTGMRVNNTGISPVTGNPIGIIYRWNYGTYTMPEWVYTWVSIALIVLSIASWNGLTAPLGSIVSLILTLILEVFGWFRPTWNSSLSDAANLSTHYLLMSITGGLLVLAILYYLQNRERGA